MASHATKRNREMFRAWMLGLATAVVLLVVGLLFVGWTVARAERQMREDLLQQTRRVAQALNIGRIQTLSGTEADLDDPDYLWIREQLAAVRSDNAQCRFLYLVGRKADGTVVFLADSEPVGAEDYSPPGQIFDEATADLFRVFDAKAEAVEGPVTDRWGTWVSALVPLINPQTGAVAAVLGMDIDAGAWKWNVARAGIPPLLLTLTLMGIVLVSSRVRSRANRWRHSEAAMTVAVGLTLTLATVWLAHTNERQSHRDAFSHLAHSQAARVAETFDKLSNTELESLASFLEGRPEVTQSAFQQFVGFLSRNPAVQAWEWIPAVHDEDRLRFEQEVRQAGCPEFGMWQKDEAGNRVPAAGRPTTYPVLYMAPIIGNERARGYDLGSEPLRRTAFEKAMRTGFATGTDPITLVQETASQTGMLVFRPVFAGDSPKRLRGFALAVLRMKTLLETAITNEAGSGIVVMNLFQLRADKPGEMLASTQQADGGRTTSSPFSVAYPIFAFSQPFSLIASPSPAFENLYPARAGWTTLLVGLVVTASIAFVVGTIVHRRKELERLIHERTNSLRASEEHLSATLRSIGDGVIALDASGHVTSLNAVAEMLTGWSTDEALGRQIAEVFRIVHARSGQETENPVARVLREDRIIGLANPTALVAREVFDIILSGRSWTGEVETVSRSGRRLTVHLRTDAIKDDEGTMLGVIGVYTDITERKRTDEMLKQVNQRMMLAANAAGFGVWELDVAADRLEWDDWMFRLYGIQREDFAGAYAAWQKGVHPDDLERVSEEVEQALRAEKDFDTEFRVVRPGGEIRHLKAYAVVVRDLQGKSIRMTGINYDITERKRAEESLQDSEANFRACFESIGDMLVVVVPGGRILYGNAALAHELGYHPQELLNMHVLDLHPADTQREAEDIFAAMERGERNTCPLPWIAKNGTLIPVETRVWPGKWNGQDCMFGIGKNLSAEQEAQQRFERLFRNNPALMALSVLPDRTFADVNDAFLAKTGYARDEVIGKTGTELALFVHPEQQATVTDRLQANDRITDFELQVRRKDGTVLDGLFSGEVISSQGRQYFLTVMIDITDRKKAETLLRLTQFSVDHSGEMVFWITRDGLLTYANDATCEQLGYTRDELRTMTMFAIHPEWPLERYIDDPRLLRSAGSLTFECMYRRKDGKLFPAEVTVTDLDHDTRICYCVFARNITERKRVLSELTAAKQSADSAAQAKIQFLANMSHEIRTPMTAIAGYLDLVNRSSEKLPENCREWVTRARRSVSHLLSLLNDILDLAKVDSGQMFLHCDLHGVVELIDEVCAFFIPQTREKLLRLTVNYSTAMPSVAFTDSTRLRQILINVIGNAVKFTETGSVAVDVSVVPLPGTDTPWLRVVVTDTGIGIPAEKLSQLFAPFTQLHDLRACRYGGTGLGLDISRRLARLFGGDVTADSTEGVGSVFTTTLPIVVPPSARWLPAVELQHVARSHPDSVLPAHDFSNRHILVVDDNPDNQSILRFLLADTNATITIAEDGLAGIRAVLAAAKTAAPFDLVLMDMRMPVMDGYVATERLREIGVRTPIVALTASVMGGDEDKCRQAGCDAYLSKPIDPAQLLATIAKYVQAPIDTQGALNTGATSRTSVNLSETARFAPLLTKYMRGLPNVMTAIRTAMEAGNTHNIRAIAHRTRGTAENFGFPELTRAAGLLEDTIDEESSVERIAAGVDAVLCLMQSALIKYKEQVAEHANAQFSS